MGLIPPAEAAGVGQPRGESLDKFTGALASLSKTRRHPGPRGQPQTPQAAAVGPSHEGPLNLWGPAGI